MNDSVATVPRHFGKYLKMKRSSIFCSSPLIGGEIGLRMFGAYLLLMFVDAPRVCFGIFWSGIDNTNLGSSGIIDNCLMIGYRGFNNW